MNRSRFLFVFVVAVMLPVVGCTWLDNIRKGGDGHPKGTDTLAKVPPERLVAYINTQSSRLQTLDYSDIRVVAYDHSVPLPALRGNLTAGQPRYFRMTGQGGAMGAKVDLGSNKDQFWVYFDAPATKPLFVFASHSDFEAGKARLPGGIPFEPDWVMQALGMTTLPPSNQYTAAPPNQKDRTYTLSWRATTPGGTPVIKEIVFDGDPALDPKPQVKKHLVRDTKDKVICSAEIRQAKTVRTGTIDPGTNQPVTVQYPTLVVLKWEEQKFEMKLDLERGEVNRTFSDEQVRAMFSRPNNLGTKPVDLALARYDSPAQK
jgi:hypothetical protein